MKRELCVSFFLPILFCAEVLIAPTSAAGETGRELLDLSGIKGGLIVYLNGSDEVATADLLVAEQYRVQALFSDEQQVQSARAKVQARGCCDLVWVKRLCGTSMPYVDNLVNLIIAEDYGSIPTDELFRVWLGPYGSRAEAESVIQQAIQLGFERPIHVRR